MIDITLLAAQGEVSARTGQVRSHGPEKLIVLNDRPRIRRPTTVTMLRPVAADRPVRRTASEQPGPGEPRKTGSLVARVMCRVKFHWEPWVYPHEGSCVQLRTCERCDIVDTRFRHKTEWGYTATDKCLQVRTCTRCISSDKNRTRHEKWSDSYSINSDTDAHKCLRCGHVERWSTAYEGGYY